MHSSRMRTARALTVSGRGGVDAKKKLPKKCKKKIGGGVLSPRGDVLSPGGVLSAGGVYLVQAGVYLVLGGVLSPEGCT